VFSPNVIHPWDELICLSWMKYLQAKEFLKKLQKHIIYMEIQNKKFKEQIDKIVVLFFNNCNPLIVVYNL
jgi:hypothetical protein